MGEMGEMGKMGKREFDGVRLPRVMLGVGRRWIKDTKDGSLNTKKLVMAFLLNAYGY